MKRLMCIILAAILLIGTTPFAVFAAGPGIPKTLYYGGEEYTLISDVYTDSYFKATSYIAVARYGTDYYALGSDLGTVALTDNGTALSAPSGVAVLTPEPNPAAGGAARITDAGKMQISGAGYLHSAGNGYLSIVQDADDTECYWCVPGDPSYSLFKVYIQDEANWWNKYHGLSFDGSSFTVSGLRSDIYVYQKVCDHAGATVYEAVEPTCLGEGSLKYSYCPTCDSYVDESGNRTFVEVYDGTPYTYVYQPDAFVLKPLGHRYVDGVCVNDGSHEARVYELVTSDDMIIAGAAYRYVIVRDDGAVFAINRNGQYSDDWVAESGAVFRADGTMILDDSSAPVGVYGAELVIEDFVPFDEYMAVPEDGTPLFTVTTETGYSLMPAYGICLDYDIYGESKYPDGLSIDPTAHFIFRMWEYGDYGDWMDPVFYDTAEGKYVNGDTRNLSLYRCAVPAGVTGKCGDDLTWTLEDGTLTISGTGAMYDYENSFEDASLNAPWRAYSTEITTIVVEDGVTYIGSFAFTQMGLVTSVTLPDSLEGLGNGAFWGCSAPTAEYDGGHYLGNEENPYLVLVYTDYYLTSCTVYPGAKIIGSNAFEAQTELTSVSIPDTVKQIGLGAFAECDALSDVDYGGNASEWINVLIEDNNDALYGATIHFPPIPIQSGTCGDDLTWTLEDGTLTISGTGAMYDYENSFEDASLNAPWRAYTSEITTIVVEEGVTYIGSFAFTQMGLITSVTLPDSLEELGNGAFWGCSAPTAEYDGGHYLGNEENPHLVLVYTDYYLTSCTVYPGAKIIGSNAFEAQTELTSVSIPASVKQIGLGAFSECDTLTDVYYNDTEAKWNEIEIEDYNDALTNATIHFALSPATVKVFCDGVEICEAAPGTTVRLPVPDTIIENGGVKRFYTWGVGGETCRDVQIGAYDENNPTSNHRTYTLNISAWWFDQFGEQRIIELTSIYFYVGDITGDGLITVADLAAMKIMLAGAGDYSDMAIEAADVFFDGLVTLADLSHMKQMLAGAYTPVG